MSIKLMLLEKAIKWLTDGSLVELVKQLVEKINDESMSGEEKKAWVIKQAKEFFTETSSFVITVVLEVSLFILRAKLGELDK